eukprot:CAMPEP_0194044802 /NCGR_PEP_ID=MMETSP0009_2-20130614/16209_1 /TAXON_ID=210454 /ORGANISM="Grammatophora oceanica, Strain CCMP 410" /LENGTH=136 /DNA_ID=CAMNT_0038689423 /DNA_START=79 /DNA_END=490 /DNA_ORIENTATION=-
MTRLVPEAVNISFQDHADIALARSTLEASQTIQGELKERGRCPMKYYPSTFDLEEWFHLNDFVSEAIDTTWKTIEDEEGTLWIHTLYPKCNKTDGWKVEQMQPGIAWQHNTTAIATSSNKTTTNETTVNITQKLSP